MCVMRWLQKLDLRILKSVTCQGFSNTEEFYQFCNVGCFWWNFLNNNPICCTYQSLFMTVTNVFGFLQKFSKSWKSCVKEQWPKNHFFKMFDFMSWFLTWGQKEGGNYDRWLTLQGTNKVEYVFIFWWTNQRLKQESVKVELFKPTTPKICIFMLFVYTNSHLTTKPSNFDIKCQSNSESYDWHGLFWTKFKVGKNFSTLRRERVL